MIAARLLTAMVVSAPATAGTFPNFADVPRFYTQNPTIWAEVLERAETETVRLAILGDSQETCPGGAGVVYIPALNFRFYLHYGNCPETTLASQASTGGDPATSPAGWLWRGGSGANSGEVDSIPAWLRPPGPRARAMRSVPPQTYGWYYTLYHDATNVADTTIPEQDYFNRTGEVTADLVVMTAPRSGEIAWRIRPTDTPPEPFAPITDSGTITLGLSAPNDPVFKIGTTPPLDYDGMAYMVLEAMGTDADVPTSFLGVRFRNLTYPDGMVVDSFSAGGMDVQELLADHGGMGPCLRTLDYDAFLIQLGTNDAFGAHRSAEYHRQDLLALIGLLREHYEDPQLPVALVIDVHRASDAVDDAAEFDQYAGAAWTIAQSDPAVLLLNMRRITAEDLGWGPDSETFLVDGVHLTALGQRQLAKKVYETIITASESESFCADPNGDGVVDVDDLVAIIVNWGRVDVPPADLNADGTVDVDDLLFVILNWGPC